MKSIQNEKGYTLLLTIVIIAIIVIFFSSFALSAMNQQKQVEKTDENYEVTAIAEMGVEYYTAEILNLVSLYVEKTKNEVEYIKSKNGLSASEKHNEIIVVNENNMNKLRLKVKELYTSTASLKTTLDSSNFKYFKLQTIPLFTEQDLSVLTIKVTGNLMSESKVLSAIYNFPTNLVIIPANLPANPSVVSGIQLLTPPNFLNTIPTPFPPSNVKECTEVLIDSECFTKSLYELKKTAFDKVYYVKSKTPNLDDKKLNNNNYDINTIYSDGGIEMGNLNNKSNDKKNFYIDGTIKFGNLNKASDMYIQGTGTGDFSSGIGIEKNISIFLNGYGTFSTVDSNNTPDGAQGLNLYSKGASFKNINGLKNSIFEIVGSLTFTEPASFKNSQIHSTGVTTGKQIDGDNSSKFYFDNGLILSSYLNAKNLSEVYIKATDTPVSANQIEVDNSKLFLDGPINWIQNGFNIGNNSTVCLKNTTISNLRMNIKDQNSKVHILGNSSSDFYYNTSYKTAIFYTDVAAFNNVCKYTTNSSTGGNVPLPPSYDPNPPLQKGEFIKSVNYE